jgi:DNA polymerase sigma|tara:strand:- start:25 stop:270 length:246 start_codon:yes stop_codon:yes gene_type:complete
MIPKDEAALMLRAIEQTNYKYQDEDEAWKMQQIKLKLMNVHPEQMEAVRRGQKVKALINLLLITFISLALAGCIGIALFVM